VLEVVVKPPGMKVVVRDDEDLARVVWVNASDRRSPVLLRHRRLSFSLLYLVADVDALSHRKS